jgi:hypothetical protein
MTKALSPPDYAAFLASLKERILQARTSAARAVNRDLILLYWDIGRGIVEKQQTAGWGEAVVERLAADLRVEFPDMRGFSVANLWRMKQFYLAHTSHDFLSQAVRVLKYADAGPEKLAQTAREFETAQRSTRHSRCLDLLEVLCLAETQKDSHPKARAAGAGMAGVRGINGAQGPDFTPGLSKNLPEPWQTASAGAFPSSAPTLPGGYS